MILVTGATGFLGNLVVEHLLANRQPLRVLTRGAGDWKGTAVSGLRQRGVEAVLADIRDPARVARAVEGASMVIHMAGILRQTREDTYKEVHVEGTRNLVSAAEVFGVERFIHVSCLATDNNDFEYATSRRQAEGMVRAGQFHWTILRPSFLFGKICKFIEMLEPLVDKPPVIPLIGGGINQVQPIAVDDAAFCVAQAVFNAGTSGYAIDLVGPQRYSVLDLVHKLQAGKAKQKGTMNIPIQVALKTAQMTGRILPQVPLTPDLVQMLISDSVADDTPMKSVFRVSGKSFDEFFGQPAQGRMP